jgi:hypothetical protein
VIVADSAESFLVASNRSLKQTCFARVRSPLRLDDLKELRTGAIRELCEAEGMLLENQR